MTDPARALDQVILRDAIASDAPYIHKSWLRSFGYDSRFAQVAGPAFWHEHSEAIKRTLDRSLVSIACWSEDPDTIVGWLVREAGMPGTLHYVFVRQEFRKMGIAKLLVGSLADGELLVSHKTKLSERITWPRGWAYNPYRGLQ